MKPCKRCGGSTWKFAYEDDTRKITALCPCGYSASWFGKPRRALTEADKPENQVGKTWEMRDGQQFLEGIEMVLKTWPNGTVGYVRAS